MQVIRVPTGVAVFPKENSQVHPPLRAELFALQPPQPDADAPTSPMLVERPEALGGEVRSSFSAL